ncbi:type III secretion protein D [Pelomonas saccharophila]|uniref:Type III secretion protein D n=1 Tax=Roseateles saccharophilus TaxID=304 RepID=A0ABU1YGH1_ROSSA|nr:FHA domain-containing protein [Roseateles saccharophilus]MDR7267955.1 type III secretion protein D [Roseateles saccharophilus]
MNARAHTTTTAAVPGWCLRFLSGAVKGRTIALKPGVNTLGASGECEVMLPGSDVLPRHLVFTVGELAMSLQKVGAAAVKLNGQDVQAQRKGVVAGDVVSVGSIDFQVDRSYPAPEHDDPASEWAESIMPGDAPPAALLQAPARRGSPWLSAAVMVLAIGGAAGVLAWAGSAGSPARAATVDLAEVEKALKPFPEVEVVAVAGGRFNVRGYVESRQRKQALAEAMAPFGRQVSTSVHAAQDIVEQARRYVSDPGISMSYAGQGRLVVSGAAEDDSVRQKIRRLADDLHPAVLVSDQVQVRPRPQADRTAELQRAQWEAWQNVLPSRMVSITQDASGMSYIQLANGSRYYEGAVLKSGAELKRIEADGLVVSPGREGQR